MSYIFLHEQDYTTAICGFSLAFTSLMYHVCDTLNINDPNTLLMMNAGQWHRLDNVFAIMIFNLLIIKLFLNLNEKQKEFSRWISLAFTLWCQEVSPWDVLYTIIPIAACLISVLIFSFFNPKLRPNYKRKNLIIGILFLSIAIFFFVRGLDDANDWIRLNHGLWHFFMSFAFYFFKNSVYSTPDVLIGKFQ